MHEEEDGDEHMPDRLDLKSAGRLGAFFDVHSIAAGGGDVDWPLSPAVHAASEPQ